MKPRNYRPRGDRRTLMETLRGTAYQEQDCQVTRRCEARGCTEGTNGLKPLCTKHVMGMPYARSLRLRNAEARREVFAVAAELAEGRAPSINVESDVAQEIVSAYAIQPGTAAHAAKCDLLRCLPGPQRKGVARAYSEALLADGQLIEAASRRGSIYAVSP